MNHARQAQTYLRNVPLFGGLGLDACQFLADQMEPRQVDGGDAVYNRGELADALYILYSGRVRLECDDLVLNELSAGAHLGDMEFFDMAPRSFTVRAMGPCEVWRVPFSAMDALRKEDLKAFALMTMNAARQMSRRLRDLDAQRCDEN